ncbi:methyltransferase domain-containing protein [Ferrimonas senticii]|uniref:methyltransferase domain-containing protein n=1 Tax=Ferrimonas senticii TaxID=394566 RepID=UPI00041A88E0|nr:methyltransferase domain-containing protein [Ferrimonas senticii]
MSKVARCFGAAAADYDNHAQLQRWAAMQLLARAQPIERWLDVGAGTGFVSARLPAEQIVQLDIAMPMLKANRGQGRLLADMQQLPLQDASVDAIAANLSLQWSESFSQSLQEAARVCRTGGQLLFSVPAEDTFSELAPLIRNGELAANRFASAEQLTSQLISSGWQPRAIEPLQLTLYFDSPKALLQHFKATGAQHANRHHGLKGRGWWQRVCQHLEQFRGVQGLPLTWKLYLVEASR